jgi:hypothetical protein
MTISNYNGDFSGWIESDYNPFILFSTSGSLIYSNNSAELLLSYVSLKIFHDLALSYAPMDFGYKTTFMNLEYDKFSYYGITVGYEDEENIGIKLYKNPKVHAESNEDISEYEESNIYVLVDLALAMASISSDMNIKKEFDPTIPEFKLPQNEFIKLLRKVFESFNEVTEITTTLKLKAGEYLILDAKKYQIIELSVSAKSRNTNNDMQIETITNNIKISARLKAKKIELDIPLTI